MITAFNRKEVYIGDLEGYQRCTALLLGSKIKFTTKTVAVGAANSGARIEAVGRTSRGLNGPYYIYVHKNDFEKASHILKCNTKHPIR